MKRKSKLVAGLFQLLLAAGWLPSAASAEKEATATVAPEVRSAIVRAQEDLTPPPTQPLD